MLRHDIVSLVFVQNWYDKREKNIVFNGYYYPNILKISLDNTKRALKF